MQLQKDCCNDIAQFTIVPPDPNSHLASASNDSNDGGFHIM